MSTAQVITLPNTGARGHQRDEALRFISDLGLDARRIPRGSWMLIVKSDTQDYLLVTEFAQDENGKPVRDPRGGFFLRVTRLVPLTVNLGDYDLQIEPYASLHARVAGLRKAINELFDEIDEAVRS